MSFAGWCLSIIVAYSLYPVLEPYLADKIQNAVILKIFGHSGLLIVVLILFSILNSFLLGKMSAIKHGIIDRSLGAVFGLFRGIIIISFFYFCMVFMLAMMGGKVFDDELAPDWVKEAATYNVVKRGKDFLIMFIPESFNERLEAIYTGVSKQTLDENFVQGTMEELSKNIAEEELAEIESLAEEEATHLSEHNVQLNKINRLLQNYRKHQGDSGSKSVSLREEDLERVQGILKSSGIN